MKYIFVWDLTEHFSNQTLLAFFQSSKDQRLVYSGRLLQDHLQLRDVLRKVQSCSLICLNIKSDAPYKNKSSDLKRSLMLLQTVWVFLIVEMLKLPLKFIDPKTVVTKSNHNLFFDIYGTFIRPSNHKWSWGDFYSCYLCFKVGMKLNFTLSVF